MKLACKNKLASFLTPIIFWVGCQLISPCNAIADSATNLSHILNFTPEELLSLNNNELIEREIKLLESDFVGVAIQSPATIDITKQSAIPVIFASRFDGTRDWKHPLLDNALLLAINLQDHKIHLSPTFPNRKRIDDAQRQIKPSDTELAGFGVQLVKLDARTILGIPWLAAHWKFSLIYYDLVSNLTQTELKGIGENRPKSTCEVQFSEFEFQAFKIESHALHLQGAYTSKSKLGNNIEGDLPITLLLVAPNSTEPNRYAWTISMGDIKQDKLTKTRFSHTLQLTSPLDPDVVAYIVVAGQVYGPQRIKKTS